MSSGSIWLDEICCSGTGLQLSNQYPGVHNCEYSEDAMWRYVDHDYVHLLTNLFVLQLCGSTHILTH